MLLGLVFLVIILLIYIIYLHRMVGSITTQLDKINSLTTNLIIMLPTRNTCLSSLVRNINHLLKINKKNYQELVSNQQQFDRAIHNISHDIRTPLTVASGYAQLLDKNATESDKAIIKKISTHLTDVEKKLNDLLTYNRLLENNVTINYSDVDVTSLMETTIISYYEAFQKSNINLSLEIEKNVQFVTDADVLKRLVENAVGNILNHGIEESAIHLTRQHDSILLFFSNKTSHTISDYSKLFNRFYTEDLARVSKNSGLGLYIIKELVTLLEGTVTANGTDHLFKLVITLPINKNREDLSIS